MVPFEMPMDARLALARMSVIYEREVGQRIRMSRDEDIVGLLNYAVDSINEEIIKQLHSFMRLLSQAELRALVAQGANLYRGAVVPERNEEEKAVVGTVTYRGQATTTSSKESKPDSPEDGAAKPKRIYRGRVIED